MSEAWVTLATNDAYALGALVLVQSLKRVVTTRKTHCILTSGVSRGMREHLELNFDAVSCVDVLDSGDAENLALIERADLGITFTKLHCWRLTQYEKAIFLDADTMFLKNADELFAERDEFSAAPDIGWPDMFNSGVFVFKPSLDTYRALLQCALTHGSFDGGDQGLLNTYFNTWRESDARYRLPFIYNMSSSAVYTYAAAYKQFGPQVKIVHFLGAVKPWHYAYNHKNGTVHTPSGHVVTSDGRSAYAHSHLLLWWHLFTHDLQPHLQPQYHPPLPPTTSSSQTAVLRPCLVRRPPHDRDDGPPAATAATVHFRPTTTEVYVDATPKSSPPGSTATRTASKIPSLSGKPDRTRDPLLDRFIRDNRPLYAHFAAHGPVPGPQQRRVYPVRIGRLKSEPRVPSAVKYGLKAQREAVNPTPTASRSIGLTLSLPQGSMESKDRDQHINIHHDDGRDTTTCRESSVWDPPSDDDDDDHSQRNGDPRSSRSRESIRHQNWDRQRDPLLLEAPTAYYRRRQMRRRSDVAPEWARKASVHAGGSTRDDDEGSETERCITPPLSEMESDMEFTCLLFDSDADCLEPEDAAQVDMARSLHQHAPVDAYTNGFNAKAGGAQQSNGGASNGNGNIYEHQRAWEAGRIDYTGRDSWDNIQRRLDASLIQAPGGRSSSAGGPPAQQSATASSKKSSGKSGGAA